MFMFRHRRHGLVKRLWKLRKGSPDRRRSGDGLKNDEEETPVLERRKDAAAQSMLKRLKESQLEDLIRSIESKGSCDPNGGPCCLIPRGDVRVVGGRHVPPHVLVAQLFRWPEVEQSFELKRLPICRHRSTSSSNAGSGGGPGNAGDDESVELYECCNPYHWSRLFKPAGASPLPPGLLERLFNSGASSERHAAAAVVVAAQQLNPLHDGPFERRCNDVFDVVNVDDSASLNDESSVVSYSTNGTQQNGYSIDSLTGRRTWCRLAYWEESTRVGRQFPVSTPSVDVFATLAKGNGLCLTSLFEQNKRPTESTTRTREKIGQGILLSHDGSDPDNPSAPGSGVWLYNRTDHPIFVNSPTLGPPPIGLSSSSSTATTSLTSTSLPPPATVYKVPPSYSVQIFDYDKSRVYERFRDRHSSDGPFDPNSIRISFAKGWGSNYSRQFVTSCPCWIEVLLEAPAR